jgi:hypothetical protein
MEPQPAPATLVCSPASAHPDWYWTLLAWSRRILGDLRWLGA